MNLFQSRLKWDTKIFGSPIPATMGLAPESAVAAATDMVLSGLHFI